MEGSVYSSIGLKVNRSFRERQAELLTLKDFLDHKFVIHNQAELKKIFVKDLKNILQKENLFDLIQSFFNLENDLNLALERLELETDLMNFEDFYKNLSPVLMRSLLECESHAEESDVVLKSIKEALRIALEEELVQLEDIEV